ncbi:hypothetical protein CF160_11315 [Enterococcus pseudoavium]|nr:hypothetical protein CF160_11315 [Enterococcus pseudoavium]
MIIKKPSQAIGSSSKFEGDIKKLLANDVENERVGDIFDGGDAENSEQEATEESTLSKPTEDAVTEQVSQNDGLEDPESVGDTDSSNEANALLEVIEQPSEGADGVKMIPGQVASKRKRSNPSAGGGRKGLRPGSVTYQIYEFILKNYGINVAFVTEGIYEAFLKQGYRSSDVSGHLHSLKRQGFLVADDWSDKELKLYGFDDEKNKFRKNLKRWMLVKEESSNEEKDRELESDEPRR